jgi:ABC-type transporter Mla subunit MlaD
MRLPYRQRLGVIINEFGTGLAGRGEDLNEVIRNADPALKATDEVLRLLASQERTLARLAEESDASLAPLARERQNVEDFVENAANLATTTADEQEALRLQFEKLPTFLQELRPTMRRLGSFADQATPVVRDLGDVAPDVSRFVKAMGPFSASGTEALTSLGEATIPGRKALKAAEPITDDLREFAATGRPLAKGVKDIVTSFKKTGGIERLLDYLFYQVAAINGYDAFGHYLRASLILNLCTTYATTANDSPVCKANFQEPIARSAARDDMTAEEALTMPGVSLQARRSAAILRGMSAAEALRLTAGQDDASTVAATTATTPTAPPVTTTQATQGEDSSAASGGGSGTESQQLLDYLLGGTE